MGVCLVACVLYQYTGDYILFFKCYVSPARGHHNKFMQPATRTDVYKYSFFPSAVKP